MIITEQQLQEWEALAVRVNLSTLDFETCKPLCDGAFVSVAIEDAYTSAFAIAKLAVEVRRLRPDLSQLYHDPENADCIVCKGDTRLCSTTPSRHCGGKYDGAHD